MWMSFQRRLFRKPKKVSYEMGFLVVFKDFSIINERGWMQLVSNVTPANR